ncbi:MAG: pesticidal protein Cry15Aa [Chloroflexi bacterium HGW-Chloroflexi-1]|nr:MAG: pesticidal protein Cry15Aa [Chloroflexi bacterium HGW-Chloroflexi-1]
MPHIKRYSNRKLYDTEARRYVSLESLAGLIRGGADVRVTDHETGEDLTAVILTQIILEQERKRAGFLPHAVLTGLIRAGGDTVSALRHGLTAPLDLLRQVDEEIERRVQRLVSVGDLAEEEGPRLRDILSTRGGWSRPEDSDHAGVVERALTARDVATCADLRALADQLDALLAALNVPGTSEKCQARGNAAPSN